MVLFDELFDELFDDLFDDLFDNLFDILFDELSLEKLFHTYMVFRVILLLGTPGYARQEKCLFSHCT